MKLRFQIYVKAHEVIRGKHLQHYFMMKENTCKSHISLSALCKYKGSVTDKRIETLETHGKRHKCSAKFKDICKFITSEDLSF